MENGQKMRSQAAGALSGKQQGAKVALTPVVGVP
jgi:hypothetical protein